MIPWQRQLRQRAELPRGHGCGWIPLRHLARRQGATYHPSVMTSCRRSSSASHPLPHSFVPPTPAGRGDTRWPPLWSSATTSGPTTRFPYSDSSSRRAPPAPTPNVPIFPTFVPAHTRDRDMAAAIRGSDFFLTTLHGRPNEPLLLGGHG